MNSIQSFADNRSLCQIINHNYPLTIDQIHLHREMIGYVYLGKSLSKKYILKLYRSFDAKNALHTIPIIQYLKNHTYPVVSMIPTSTGEMHIVIETPQGPSIAILYEYIEGVEPNIETEMIHIGRQVGWLHRLMKAYSGPIIHRGKEFYVDRYMVDLRELNYDPKKIDDLEAYGSQCWNRIQCLPGGFCHGDLHSGNMIQSNPNEYILFDFDAASHTTSMIDAATLCDGTHFNHFDETAYDRTRRRLERFYRGYSLEGKMNDLEIAAIFDFIPIRHYELIATITKCQGLHRLSNNFLDEQYDWLMRWKNLCEQKGYS